MKNLAAPVATPMPDAPIGAMPDDQKFGALSRAFRATGGVVRGDDLARLLEYQRCSTRATLSTLIVAGEVFAFKWRKALWVPMFQFELRDLSIKQGSRRVLAELSASFDGWALAVWFASPNCWLKERAPVDLLDSSLPAVLDAARADRYIANG